MSFLIKDKTVLNKYNEIQNVMKNKIGIKFHRKPIYDQTYVKAKKLENLMVKLKQTF